MLPQAAVITKGEVELSSPLTVDFLGPWVPDCRREGGVLLQMGQHRKLKRVVVQEKNRLVY